MNQPANERFAPPSSPVADVAPADAPIVLASRWARLGAALIDGIVIAVLGQLLRFLWDYPALLASQMSQDLLQQGFVNFYSGFHASAALLGAINIVLFLVANGYFVATRGQTIGKMALGLRMVMADGSRASPFRLLVVRYVLAYQLPSVIGLAVAGLYGFLDACFIFGPARRCLHDRIAGTIVVRAN